MLNIASFSAPGLSVVVDDDLPTAVGDLGSPRYRRWVERVGERLAARQRRVEQSGQPTGVQPGTVGRRRRIRLPSPASGTLSRLP